MPSRSTIQSRWRLDGQRIRGVAGAASRQPSPRTYRRSAQGPTRSCSRFSRLGGLGGSVFSRSIPTIFQITFKRSVKSRGLFSVGVSVNISHLSRGIQLLNERKRSPALELVGLVVTLTLGVLRFLLPDDRATVSGDVSDEDQYARRLRVGRVETESLAKFAEV